MYIAMNRFRVPQETAQEFEQVWRSRQSYLGELPGFVEFALLKGPEKDGVILYASHTVWDSKANFTNWTTSEQFRKAHANAGKGKPLSIGHPEFEGFEAIIVESNPAQGQAAE